MARFAGAGDAVLALRYQLWRIARDELAAIDRHEARPVYEPLTPCPPERAA